jgi:serine/arginine repetitive matrix protein 2
MTTLEGLIGKIPSNPLWAEVLALKTREKQARRVPSSQSLKKDKERRSASGMSGKSKIASKSGILKPNVG